MSANNDEMPPLRQQGSSRKERTFATVTALLLVPVLGLFILVFVLAMLPQIMPTRDFESLPTWVKIVCVIAAIGWLVLEFWSLRSMSRKK
jgi:protein-S-isoprenylcysteine O-methyltransferase Ste14